MRLRLLWTGAAGFTVAVVLLVRGGEPAAGKGVHVSENRPADEEPIDAEVVGDDVVEASEVTSGSELPEPSRPYRAYRPRKRGSALGKVVFLLGLVLVAVGAVAYREELTEAYDRIVERLFDRSQEEPEGKIVRKEAKPEAKKLISDEIRAASAVNSSDPAGSPALMAI